MTMTAEDAQFIESRQFTGGVALRANLVNVRETRHIPFTDVELRSDDSGKTLHFRGYASVTEAPYEMEDMFGTYTEVVRSGAFKRTLAEGADVGLVVNHEGIPLARTKSGTLTLAEDGKGLLADAPGLDPGSPLVQTVRSAMDRKDLDEMSMAFRVNDQDWSPDYTQRDIRQVNLHKGDVSIVNYGANPNASGATLRSLLQFREGIRGVRLAEVTDLFRDLRSGATLSQSTSATLRHLLSLFAAADNAVDEGQEVLAELLGVPNPDTPDDMGGDDPEPMQMNADNLWAMEMRDTIARLHLA